MEVGLMTSASTAIIAGLLGFIAGGCWLYLITSNLEKKRAILSNKRQQLKLVYSPLEALVKINGQEFDHYFKNDATNEDREFIEKTIWHPNFLEIKKVIMEHAHLLDQLPDELLRLLNYINIWLSDYDAVYVRQLKDAPVFVRPDGYSYPGEADEFIYQQAGALRKELNR
jgi:hypothetical protein